MVLWRIGVHFQFYRNQWGTHSQLNRCWFVNLKLNWIEWVNAPVNCSQQILISSICRTTSGWWMILFYSICNRLQWQWFIVCECRWLFNLPSGIWIALLMRNWRNASLNCLDAAAAPKNIHPGRHIRFLSISEKELQFVSCTRRKLLESWGCLPKTSPRRYWGRGCARNQNVFTRMIKIMLYIVRCQETEKRTSEEIYPEWRNGFCALFSKLLLLLQQNVGIVPSQLLWWQHSDSI